MTLCKRKWIPCAAMRRGYIGYLTEDDRLQQEPTSLGVWRVIRISSGGRAQITEVKGGLLEAWHMAMEIKEAQK